jgi:hypothetical protein
VGFWQQPSLEKAADLPWLNAVVAGHCPDRVYGWMSHAAFVLRSNSLRQNGNITRDPRPNREIAKQPIVLRALSKPARFLEFFQARILGGVLPEVDL